MRALHILHLVANPWWTGGAAPALELSHALAARGHRVIFACIRGEVLEARARAVGLPPPAELSLRRTTRPWMLARDVAAMRRLVAREGIELVHAHSSHDHWLAAVALHTLARPAPRLVRTVHHRRGVHRGPAFRWLTARTDALIAVSAGIGEALEAAGVAPPRVSVVAGAVDVERFRPGLDGSAVRAELRLGTSPVVACIARLVPGRGHDRLLHAMAALRGRLPAARLVLVGRGEGRPALEALVGRLGLAEHVVFAGYRGDDDLPAVIAAADVVALLGAGSEESCRAALEAMAVGRPVVAARVGALPQTVVDGETGWLVDGRPEEVADRLATLLLFPARARAMGEAGHRRVLAGFTQERRATAVEAIYARILPAA